MKLGLLDIKQALLDSRFRNTLPHDIREEVAKFLENPSCPCNTPLYRKILSQHLDKLKAYYPNKEVAEVPDIVEEENQWTVINCRADELEDRLRKLPKGRKQLAVARYEDLVTVVVNELG